MISAKELDAMERRVNDAAPGPWRRGVGNDSRKVYDANDCIVASDCAQRSGTFAAHARTDIILLINEVRRLYGEKNDF